MSTPSILDQLNKTSSAEDFFKILDVDYDERVVNVARLHILRRMGQYLVSEDFTGLGEAEAKDRCGRFLAQAYADFVASSPIEERVFKVLKDAVRPAPEPKLVQLSALK